MEAVEQAMPLYGLLHWRNGFFFWFLDCSITTSIEHAEIYVYNKLYSMPEPTKSSALLSFYASAFSSIT